MENRQEIHREAEAGDFASATLLLLWSCADVLFFVALTEAAGIYRALWPILGFASGSEDVIRRQNEC